MTPSPPLPPPSRQQLRAQMRQQLFRRITPTVLSRRQRRLLSRTVIQQWKPAVQMETSHV